MLLPLFVTLLPESPPQCATYGLIESVLTWRKTTDSFSAIKLLVGFCSRNHSDDLTPQKPIKSHQLTRVPETHD